MPHRVNGGASEHSPGAGALLISGQAHLLNHPSHRLVGPGDPPSNRTRADVSSQVVWAEAVICALLGAFGIAWPESVVDPLLLGREGQEQLHPFQVVRGESLTAWLTGWRPRRASGTQHVNAERGRPALPNGGRPRGGCYDPCRTVPVCGPSAHCRLLAGRDMGGRNVRPGRCRVRGASLWGSDECALSGHVAADDKRLDLSRALVGD